MEIAARTDSFLLGGSILDPTPFRFRNGLRNPRRRVFFCRGDSPAAAESSVVKRKTAFSAEDSSGRVKMNRRRPWWAPIFKSITYNFEEEDQSDDDDYDPSSIAKDRSSTNERKTAQRSAVFTDEKARKLRRLLRDTEILQDYMYHSPIASRLAFPDDD